MFVIVYNKATKKIVYFRNDLAVPQVHTAQYWFDMFLEDNKIDDENHAFAEVTYTKDLSNIVIGNHVYNEATNAVEEDPNYVAPISEPTTPAEPTV